MQDILEEILNFLTEFENHPVGNGINCDYAVELLQKVYGDLADLRAQRDYWYYKFYNATQVRES